MSFLVYKEQFTYMIHTSYLGPPEDLFYWKVLLKIGHSIKNIFLPHVLLLKKHVYFRHSWAVFDFVSAIWLPHWQLWALVLGKTAFTRCYSLRPIYIWPEGHRKSLNEAGSLSLGDRPTIQCGNWWNFVTEIFSTSLRLCEKYSC